MPILSVKRIIKSVTPFVVQEWSPPTTSVHLQTHTLDNSSAYKRRAVFSQPVIVDQIWIQCPQSTSNRIV